MNIITKSMLLDLLRKKPYSNLFLLLKGTSCGNVKFHLSVIH